MKKLFILSIICLYTLFASAQTKQSDLNEYVFYGVDFSQVNVIGSDETKEQFLEAFNGIENLLINEPKKFDLAKYAKINIINTDIDIAKERINLLVNKDFFNRETTPVNAEDYVSIYGKDGKMGIIIVAKEFNKPNNNATYVYIFFNGQTKEIINIYEKKGKAGGFGLKNYWAGSLYNSMKK